MSTNLVCGFIKLRNGILRGGNLYRVLRNMEEYCDEIFVVDDASYDGSYEYLQKHILLPEERIIRVPQSEHDFASELHWKQELLEKIHTAGPYEYIMWMDDDEVLDSKGTAGLRDFCRANLDSKTEAWAFHYTQVWRNTSWARTDDGFDDGWFYKLWRYSPALSFEVQAGTHKAQFPRQIHRAISTGQIDRAPFEIIHYGNAGINLRMKCIQYYGGLGGVDRHLHFEEGKFRPVPKDLFPEGAEIIEGDSPTPFTSEQCERILSLTNMQKLKETFCVIIPSYNRASTLPRALDSLLGQTYQKWICFVLDDGSTDNTEEVVNKYVEADPRIFYLKYHVNRGGVAMNEIGMEIAVNTAEYWTRLGSDDWFLSNKLELDAKVFEEHSATYGPFMVHRKGVFNELGNLPCPSEIILPGFLKQGFYASWANCAVRSSVLAAVKEKFGSYCDARLQNMEDRLFNFRVAKLTPWIWRGMCEEELIINPDMQICQDLCNNQKSIVKLLADGVWNVNQVGASASIDIYNADSSITTQLIEQEKDL